MSVLPYCIFLSKSVTKLSNHGVRESKLQSLDEGMLRVVYSEIEQQQISAQTFQNDALTFHEVVHAIFERAAVVPFRFPTWLTAAELRKHLAQESVRYCAFLTQHAEHVQMEVRLSPPATSSRQLMPMTGTEHLRQRSARQQDLRATAEGLRRILAGEVVEWRARESAEGVRLFALVHRDSVASFREKLGGYDHDKKLHFSGPWPAAEFLLQAK